MTTVLLSTSSTNWLCPQRGLGSEVETELDFPVGTVALVLEENVRCECQFAPCTKVLTDGGAIGYLWHIARKNPHRIRKL